MHCLPDSCNDAATNMAADQLMLTAYPSLASPRFRHYGWKRDAFTFGFAQVWGEALQKRQQEGYEVIRRETGGGLVDHRDDWTYALVIPTSHPHDQGNPSHIYHDIHHCLIQAIQQQGFRADLQAQAPPPNPKGAFKVCFQRTECNDVVTVNQLKIAGAAQRRSREGLLIQGSICRSILPNLNWETFKWDFMTGLSQWLHSTQESVIGCRTSWPSIPGWKRSLYAGTE